jgi:hypothetical protein
LFDLGFILVHYSICQGKTTRLFLAQHRQYRSRKKNPTMYQLKHILKTLCLVIFVIGSRCAVELKAEISHFPLNLYRLPCFTVQCGLKSIRSALKFVLHQSQKTPRESKSYRACGPRATLQVIPIPSHWPRYL